MLMMGGGGAVRGGEPGRVGHRESWPGLLHMCCWWIPGHSPACLHGGSGGGGLHGGSGEEAYTGAQGEEAHMGAQGEEAYMRAQGERPTRGRRGRGLHGGAGGEAYMEAQGERWGGVGAGLGCAGLHQ